MSASEALTIWMLSTAMKAPSVAPITAIQVFAETAGADGVPAVGRTSLTGTVSVVVCSVVMVGCSRARCISAAGPRTARRQPLLGFALGDSGRFGVDGRHHRHARTQQATQARIVEHDLHRHALHDLGE